MYLNAGPTPTLHGVSPCHHYFLYPTGQCNSSMDRYWQVHGRHYKFSYCLSWSVNPNL